MPVHQAISLQAIVPHLALRVQQLPQTVPPASLRISVASASLDTTYQPQTFAAAVSQLAEHLAPLALLALQGRWFAAHVQARNTKTLTNSASTVQLSAPAAINVPIQMV